MSGGAPSAWETGQTQTGGQTDAACHDQHRLLCELERMRALVCLSVDATASVTKIVKIRASDLVLHPVLSRPVCVISITFLV